MFFDYYFGVFVYNWCYKRLSYYFYICFIDGSLGYFNYILLCFCVDCKDCVNVFSRYVFLWGSC